MSLALLFLSVMSKCVWRHTDRWFSISQSIIQVKQRTIIHGGMDRSWNTLTINFYQICVFRNMYSVVMIMEEILNYRTFSLWCVQLIKSGSCYTSDNVCHWRYCFYQWCQNVFDVTPTDDFQYHNQFLCMQVANWPNIFVYQGQFRVPDLISYSLSDLLWY
jgi:hypothetical protein